MVVYFKCKTFCTVYTAVNFNNSIRTTANENAKSNDRVSSEGGQRSKTGAWTRGILGP